MRATPAQATILIVDDQIENASLLLAYLESSGFHALIVRSGEEALEQVEHIPPDVILLDVMMSGIDGFETCRRLKQRTSSRDIPVIFMTALTESDEKIRGFQAGGADYITKPFECDEVVARVNAHFSNRQLQKQLQEERSRFETLSEATFEGILIHDNGHILDINQAIVTLFGYTRAELTPLPILRLFSPEFQRLITEQAHLENGPYEAVGLKKDGTLFPVEIHFRPMLYQEHLVSVMAIRDITWRKQMEQEQATLRKENLTLRSTMHDRYRFGDIIGKSAAMQEVYEAIVRAAASDANVVISGESGTGKELVAQTIHTLSDRREHDFVAVNCGAVPESLFEREFFGHRKGAFTSATHDQPGYFDQAQGGTLFLDEVGELSPALQVKLLRVLQNKQYIPLGDSVSQKVDVRIIAATNRDLKDLLQQRLMREDFFYRIRVTVINLPSLRERREDIPLLVEHFLAHYQGDHKDLKMPAQVMDAISAYSWPGNVRELQNELQRYLAERRMEFLDSFDAFNIGTIVLETAAETEYSLHHALEAFEKRFITEIFDRQYKNRTLTATVLGIDRKTLYTKLKKYGVI